MEDLVPKKRVLLSGSMLLVIIHTAPCLIS